MLGRYVFAVQGVVLLLVKFMIISDTVLQGERFVADGESGANGLYSKRGGRFDEFLDHELCALCFRGVFKPDPLAVVRNDAAARADDLQVEFYPVSLRNRIGSFGSVVGGIEAT